MKRRDGWSRRQGVLEIGASYVYLDDDLGVTRAIAASGLHPDDASSSSGFYGIIEAYVDHDKPHEALALVEKWIQPDDRDDVYDLIAHKLAKMGDTEGALRLAQRIREQLRRTRAIAAV